MGPVGPVAMSRERFDGLDADSLCRICMEPVFRQIRGRDMEMKAAVISRLNEGQRSLCMFEIFYRHAKNSAEEYYGWVGSLLSQPGVWDEILRGLAFFGDESMTSLLTRTEDDLRKRNARLGLSFEQAVLTDLERDGELRGKMTELYRELEDIAPVTQKNIAVYIRSHPDEFVVWED